MKVVIVGEFSEASKKSIEGEFPSSWEIAIVDRREIKGELKHAQVIIPEHIQIDGPLLDGARHLKLVQTGAGFDNVDIDACAQRGVYVANAAGVNAAAVAEHVFAFILCWYKNLTYLDRRLRQGEYDVNYTGAELANKVIGIIGLGNIGLYVGRLAKAFGMRTLGYDIRPGETSTDIERTDLATLFKQSDIITLHVFLNDQTRHMISSDQLAIMKQDVFLINTARGPIIDEEALIEALKEKRIGGAGIDVFENEPLPPDSSLRKLDTVILTPHTAGMPDGLKFHKKRYEFFVDNIQRVLIGKKPHNALNQI